MTQAQELPDIDPTRDHPEHHMKWTPAEIKWIKAYGQRCVEAYKASQPAKLVPMTEDDMLNCLIKAYCLDPIQTVYVDEQGTTRIRKRVLALFRQVEAHHNITSKE